MVGNSDSTLIEIVGDSSLRDREGSRRYPVLIVLEGKQQNLRITLDKEEMVLGRDLNSDITVEDGLASRKHATLVYANIDRHQEIPDCRIFDEKSTNGTFVNEERVEPEGAWLADRDRVRIGRTVFGFFIRDEEEIRLDSKLAELATSDALTGLHNKLAFDAVLQPEYQRARTENRPLSVALLEIDAFKEVNDTHGRPAGDSAIRQVASMLTDANRTGDSVARLGGGRFALLLRGANGEGAYAYAERLRKTISGKPFVHGSVEIRLKVSVGIAGLVEGITTPGNLVDRADVALSQAKKKNGDKTVLYENL